MLGLKLNHVSKRAPGDEETVVLYMLVLGCTIIVYHYHISILFLHYSYPVLLVPLDGEIS